MPNGTYGGVRGARDYPLLDLHKLGDKDHDDDDRNDKTKKEKPDLEKSLFPCCFIKV